MISSFFFDHVHLSAPDQAEAGAWYIKHLDARAGSSPERVLVGDQLSLIFYKAERAVPTGDSVIDAIGFSVADVATKARQLTSAGATLVSAPGPLPGLGHAAIVEDPYGARLTLVAASAAAEAVAFHHVHLRVPDPSSALTWYTEMFGGTRTTLNAHVPAVQYGPTWLLAEKGDGTPSAGHAIDHIAWRTLSLDVAADALKSKSVVFTMEPRQFNPTTRISFVEGPAGTRIEVLERQ